MHATTTVAAVCNATTWMAGIYVVLYDVNFSCAVSVDKLRLLKSGVWNLWFCILCTTFLKSSLTIIFHYYIPFFLQYRHFILDLVKRNIPFHEAIMNLPANATDFLDVFIGLYTRVGEDR